MNPGDSVQDVSRSESDETSVLGAAAGLSDGKLSRSLRTQKSLQDIQEIIDKLAAVTQQLRRPRSVSGSSH